MCSGVHAFWWADKEFYREQLDCRRHGAELGVASDLRGLETVHVVYAVDAQRFSGVFASMVSLAVHLGRPSLCTIHLVVPRGDLDRAEGLLLCLKRELAARSVAEELQPQVVLHQLKLPATNRSRFKVFLKHNPSLYIRWYLPDYLPNVSRAIWLDDDTIVRTDISALYRMEMQHAVAAPASARSFGWFWFMRMCRSWLAPGGRRALVCAGAGRNTSKPPLHAGLLLVDLSAWRQQGVAQSLELWAERFNGLYKDMFPMVAHFGRRYDRLDWRWHLAELGLHSQAVPSACTDQAKVLHFSGHCKPWACHNPNSPLWDAFRPNPSCAALLG